ncbi:MAG: hypothetical protein JSS81_25490 [Acidobacteria bacterium]|nr:hypothetical protein [Acidobacteriota bacterium]
MTDRTVSGRENQFAARSRSFGFFVTRSKARLCDSSDFWKKAVNRPFQTYTDVGFGMSDVGIPTIKTIWLFSEINGFEKGIPMHDP